jgi:hypothetical protein
VKKKSEFGLGGPRSWYYDGWFSELVLDVDSFEKTTKNNDDEIIGIIESTVISFPTKEVDFHQNSWLTPAFWLDVPEEWKNEYFA